MQYQTHLNKIPMLQYTRNVYLVLVITLSFTVILLSMTLLLKKDRSKTIIVPAHFNQSFWINNDGVSSQYLAEMARFLSQQFFNLTPENANQQLAYVLQWVHPKDYHTVKQQFVAISHELTDKNMTTVFYPQSVEVLLPNMTVKLHGLYEAFVAEKMIERKPITIELNFEYTNGKLYVIGVESKNDKK